ncbi:MAG TPA: sigma-54 dependent transcriptional regulator [Candidatus Brocadiia bacterium]|nr:sigma-54 dependent transcriptional regulator [Candidatus Brocadiia bacterium]
MNRRRILVVDDRPNMLKLLSRVLGRRYEVTTAASGQQALALASAADYDVIVTDVRMPEVSGMDVLRQVKARRPLTQVIVMTAYGEIPQAVEAMRLGAVDYLTKPFEPETIELAVDKAVEQREALEQERRPREEEPAAPGWGAILGKSPAIRRAFHLLRKAADSDSTVLIQGESGAGKELFARAIHAASARAAAPFIPVNCGAIPPDLMESELFGHALGAFTGAVKAKTGLFQEAENGILFLDEVSELRPDLQIKLNRAIQEHEVRPVGENRPLTTNARVLAATNRNLRELVDAGQFRQDLYFRLSVFPITVPPLRDRMEDVPLLAASFLERFARRENRKIASIDPAALKILLQHSWPGNVRELENLIERAVLLEEGPTLSAETVSDCMLSEGGPAPAALAEGLPYKEAMELASRQASRQYAAGLLAKTQGNVTAAAELAGIERESFHRLLRKLGLRASDFRET